MGPKRVIHMVSHLSLRAYRTHAMIRGAANMTNVWISSAWNECPSLTEESEEQNSESAQPQRRADVMRSSVDLKIRRRVRARWVRVLFGLRV